MMWIADDTLSLHTHTATITIRLALFRSIIKIARTERKNKVRHNCAQRKPQYLTQDFQLNQVHPTTFRNLTFQRYSMPLCLSQLKRAAHKSDKLTIIHEIVVNNAQAQTEDMEFKRCHFSKTCIWPSANTLRCRHSLVHQKSTLNPLTLSQYTICRTDGYDYTIYDPVRRFQCQSLTLALQDQQLQRT